MSAVRTKFLAFGNNVRNLKDAPPYLLEDILEPSLLAQSVTFTEPLRQLQRVGYMLGKEEGATFKPKDCKKFAEEIQIS